MKVACCEQAMLENIFCVWKLQLFPRWNENIVLFAKGIKKKKEKFPPLKFKKKKKRKKPSNDISTLK